MPSPNQYPLLAIVGLAVVTGMAFYLFSAQNPYQTPVYSCTLPTGNSSVKCPDCTCNCNSPACPTIPACPASPSCPSCPSCPAPVFTGSTGSSKPAPRTITQDQINAALKKVGEALFLTDDKKPLPGKLCDFGGMGTDNGKHDLCTVPRDCKFLSYGIRDDYSFDRGLAVDHNCSGLALDPTVTHPSKIHDNVWFMSVGATMPAAIYPPNNKWIIGSVPKMMKFAEWDYIDILKMDCEGCEYQLGPDALNEDPDLFKKIGQFAVEVHISQFWTKNDQIVDNLGILYHLLYEAGLQVMSVVMTPCEPYHDSFGCPAKAVAAGYHCLPGRMCQNILFGRSPK